MKITFAAEDGTTFDSEEDCIAYENMEAQLRGFYQGKASEEELGLEPGFYEHLKNGFYMHSLLFQYRKSFIRLADLLRPASRLES
jgi:hypothetical protein